MSAQHHDDDDHEAVILAELDAVAPDNRYRRSDAPTDAADVAAMTPQERGAWLATTTGRRRWSVLIDGKQRRPSRKDHWREEAACRDEANSHLTDLTSHIAGAQHAQRLCASCPVLEWCAADARGHLAYGLWAGVVLINGRAAQELPGKVLVDPTRWLADQLASGPRPRKALLAAGRPLGIGEKRLNNAADALGIIRASGKPWTLPGHHEAAQRLLEDHEDQAQAALEPLEGTEDQAQAVQPPLEGTEVAVMTARAGRSGQRWQPRRRARRKARR